MVTKLHPVGDYIYSIKDRRLESPQGCTLDREGDIFVDERRVYCNVVPERGIRHDYFVPVNDSDSSSLDSRLEERVEIPSVVEADNWKEIAPVLYILGTGFGLGLLAFGYSIMN